MRKPCGTWGKVPPGEEETMRRLALGGGRAWTEEVERPEPEPGWVVVKAIAVPICGSDRGAFLTEGEHRWAGHEGTGVVEAVPARSSFRPGERVVIAPQATCGDCQFCRSGDWVYCRDAPPSATHFAEYVKKQEALLPRLPDDLSLEVGSLAGCALCPAFSALDRAHVGASDTVVVTGLGPVGLGAVAVASFRGARVLGVEPEPYRRKLALRLGAEAALAPQDGASLEWVREQTDGEGASVAAECSGTPEGLRLCVDAAAVLGRVAVIGENHSSVRLGPSDDFIRKGLTVQGTWFMNRLAYPRVFDLIRRKPVVAEVITHEFPLTRAQDAFETFLSGKSGKVLLKPWD